MSKQLNTQEELFVSEYLIDLNPEAAALRAGYSESVARTKAYLWVSKSKHSVPASKAHVWESVQKAMGERVDRVKVDADYVLMRHHEIDQMDICDILSDDWTLKPIGEWPKVWRTYISAFDVSEIMAGQGDSKAAIGFIKKLKWPDKLRNLELLGKHVSVQAYKEAVAVDHSLIEEISALMDETAEDAPGRTSQ